MLCITHLNKVVRNHISMSLRKLEIKLLYNDDKVL